MDPIIGAELPIDRRRRVHTRVEDLPLRAPAERVCDFKSVLSPLTPEEAQDLASCCIHCPEPATCVAACPVHNDIPTAMWLAEQGDFVGAAEIYRQTSSLPEICGLVCPHESLCEGACVRVKKDEPVLTGLVEAFVTTYERGVRQVDIELGPATGKRVAIIGSGPSGLGCAHRLLEKGHQVTIFDKLPAAGGLLMYGIPDFKLPKEIVASRIEDFVRAGVEFVHNIEIGVDVTIDELLEDRFDAVYIAVGTWVEAPLKVSGIDLPGVLSAADFLLQAKVEPEKMPARIAALPVIGERVVVIGGGDTAADCLRTALRLGAKEVTCLYRRTENEMPGIRKDRLLAEDEGAYFRYLTQPIGFYSGDNDRVAEIECLTCELGPADKSGRRSPVPIEGSNFRVEADTVVLALGYWPDPKIGESTPGLETRNWGLVVADPATGATSRTGVFAGGDAVTGPDLVVTAMLAGQQAAAEIDRYLMN